ncbi:MAG: metal-dependent hydrolase [Pseudomonadales bacterium]
MDPISQGAAGAALSGTAATRRQLLAAGAVGALAGMAPDLDVLIRSPTDPLLFLEYHRQFTHSLIFIPLGALLCALPLHLLVRRWLRFHQTYLFAALGYATHGLLDACTSYGTQLLWPFSDARIAWNAIAVVDPLFTLPLLGLLAAALVRRQPWLARAGLLWGLSYLALGAFQGVRAEHAAQALAHSRGHDPQRLTAKPSFGNLLVWKSIYADGDWFYVDALRVGLRVSYFPGERARRLDRGRDLPWLDKNSQQARDVERFRRFSGDFLAVEATDPTRIVDVRYSMVPNEIEPLWGIRLERGAPLDQHVEFFMSRRATAEHRQALGRMLRTSGGEPITSADLRPVNLPVRGPVPPYRAAP